jgi:excisionase family DNA binding protein
MKLLNYIKSFINNSLRKGSPEALPPDECKENVNPSTPPTMNQSKEFTEPLLTVSQAAKKHGVTRQAIFFAIKMKRLNARKENETWLIAASDLKDYYESKYSRARSIKEGKLIFDKDQGFYSISEAADILGKNMNHVYYLVRMGKLKTHRQGTAIVIQDTELQNYLDFIGKKSDKNMSIG